MLFSFGHLTEVDLRATPELLVRDATLSYLPSWELTEPTAGGIGGATVGDQVMDPVGVR